MKRLLRGLECHPARNFDRHHRAIRAMQVTVGLILCAFGTAAAMAAEAGSSAGLRAAYAAHRAAIEQSKFGKPLYLESKQTSNSLHGDIVAIVEQPFDRVQQALGDARSWCDILILHPNVKACRLNGNAGKPSLTVNLGRAEFPAEFSYAAAKSPDYLDVQLGSPTGPMGTTDYRIRLEAAPLDDKRTLMRLAYSHGYGARARIAMQTYFNTLGRGKVGFTVVGKDPNGQPQYVSDLRGGLERNAMRYYASIESYLVALSAPKDQQLDRRLRHWYAYTERFPLQLQEEQGYLEVKRREAERTAQSHG